MFFFFKDLWEQANLSIQIGVLKLLKNMGPSINFRALQPTWTCKILSLYILGKKDHSIH